MNLCAVPRPYWSLYGLGPNYGKFASLLLFVFPVELRMSDPRHPVHFSVPQVLAKHQNVVFKETCILQSR